MSGDEQETGGSYIPERYKQQIAARKRRQLGIRIATVIVVIAVCAIVYSFLAGPGQGPVPEGPTGITPVQTEVTGTPPASGSPEMTPFPTGTTSASTPLPTGGTSGLTRSPALLAAQNETGIIPYTSALAFLNDDFPSSAFTPVSADIQTLPNGKRMYAFIIRPAASTTANTFSTVYIDAVTGDPYTPSQDEATILQSSVRSSVANIFPGLHPDRIRVRYSPDNGQPSWNFTLIGSSVTLLTGSIDAATGDLISFRRVIPLSGRQTTSVIDNITADRIAERYINDRNGPVSIQLTSGQYAPLGTVLSPFAGSWVFVYSRVVQDYPCDVDGYTVSVDSVSGDITGYERRWSDPEYAFVISPIPSIMEREATYTVLRKAQDTFPGLVNGVTVLSADLRWKDGHPAGAVPRPGSIPLAWKIVFDDEVIRSNPSLVPAEAWVNVQSGSLLEFNYRH